MASCCSSNDKCNFQWVTVASVDLIKLPLRDILASHIKPADLFQKIQSCSTLKLLPDQQKFCLIQPPGLPDYNTFDFTLLYTLIRNLCCLPSPAQGWGKEPKAKDIEISDDIERLRLFRNNYYGHAISSSISDAIFEDVWRNLKLVIKRFNSKKRCSTDYEEELIMIERSKFTDDHLKTCRILLDAFASIQNQTNSKDEPDISIIGENEKKCGETALFEANVEMVKSSNWTITWYKHKGNVSECIDTSKEKYRGSTKRRLVIKSVCKEDEGKYQAVLSFELNGPDYRSKNTIPLYVLEDVLSVKIFVNSPVCFGSKTIIKSEVSSTTTPEKIEWQKSKDGIDFHCIIEPILFRTTARLESPFYVIPKTTFTDKLYYRLLVWNENGEGVSNNVYLDVTGNPPNIMTSFNTNIKDRSVKLIGNLYVYDDSPGILETFWTKNEKKINPEKSGWKLSEISNENPSLTIKNVSTDDAGEYRLTATNAVGSSTSDVIVLGYPIIFLEKFEDKKNGRHSITVMIESLPAPYHVQWSSKNKDDEHYTPIDINTEEYEGTTVSFPHPVLVLRQKDQLEKNCFKIEVTNFIGKTVHEISGENKPVVLRSTDNVKETPYNDHGASVRFTRLNNILADEFPLEKVEKLKFLLKTSKKVKNRRSVLEATSAMNCLTILQDENLFTQADVIFMQFLCRETGCLKLNEKCIDYAEKQNALCFFEKQSVNGCVDVQFHVQGDISGYTKEFIREVIETVAAILDCKEEDIHLNAVRYSTSFFLSLSIKKVYIRKLLALKEQDRLKLKNLNIDYLKIDEETIYLNIGEDNKMECGIRENSNADVDDIETEQALRDENNRKSKVEEIDSEEEHKNLLVKNDDDELFSEFELMDLMPFLSDYEDEPVDDQERESTEEEKKAEFITVISSDSDSGHSNSDDVNCSEKEGVERKKPSKKNLKKAEERGKNVKERQTTRNDTVEPEKKKKSEIKDKHYVYFGGERYVDLGLGSHRVKCRVHRDYRLIVVAEKNVVYKRFPIPLINRLEKHFLNISTLLSPLQLKLTRLLDEWADKFISPLNCENEENKMTKMDVFIGYHADTCASIILYICHELCEEHYDDSNSNSKTSDEEEEEMDDIDEWVDDNKDKILEQSKDLLLWCATPDAVLRLGMTDLREDEKEIRKKYFFQQRHEDLWSCILHHLEKSKTEGKAIRLQITTNSNLLTPGEVKDIANCTNIDPGLVSILSLQSFDTEQQFCRQLRRSFEMNNKKDDIFVIIQCDNGIENSGLIACAHYCVLDELQILSTEKKEQTHIVFILRLPRMSKSHFTGFQCGIWKTVHIDDLRTNDDVPRITDMVGKSIRALLEDAVETMSGNIIQSENGATQKDVLYLRNQDSPESFIPIPEPILFNPPEKATQYQEVHHIISKSFDFLSLVKKCVQSSLSMVKYPDNPQRSTQCVKTWIRLLHETEKPDHASFTMGICRHLCAMLMVMENAVFGDKANEWVTCDATKREHVNGAGTFRQAMIQYIVQKLSPLLADIISKIDTNQNLDLMDESEESWKRRLWLEILNCPEATNNTHSMLDFRPGTVATPEFVVLGTRSDNHMFSAKFPFSWIISKLVQSAIQTEGSIKSEDEQSNKMIGQICTIIEGSALGLILSKCLQYVKETDLMSAYIHDFLCMDYPVCSDNELELVCDNLKTGVSKLLNDTEAHRSGLNCIVATHIAYKKYQCVFQNFHCITEVWPNIQENLKNENKSIWKTDEEEILDAIGLTLLVSSLEPKPDTFTDKRGRQNWLLTVNIYRPVVEKIFYLQSGESSNRRKELKEARSQWTRVMVVKLFLENVCSVLDVQGKRCIVLWRMLKGEADMKNVSCLEKIEKTLKSCATELRNRAYRDQQQCKSCESKIVERPVQLPCGDIICANCYRETSITGPTKCPVCHIEFKEDFKPGSTNISSSEIKDYETFKTCGDRFYRDVVAQLCFSEGETPSREVIEKLMSHIVNAPNSSNEDELMSKNMSILEEGFDQVPVVRSFLLQQILRTSNNEVENILEAYIDKAQEMFRIEHQKCLLELSFLIINCLEDSCMYKCMTHPQPTTAELRITLEVLAKNRQKMKTTTFGIKKFICLSESRFGLSVTADCMGKIALPGQRLEKEIKKYMEVLSAAQQFCTDCGSAFPRLYIVKCICQRFGAECLEDLRKSDNEEIRKLIDLPELKPIQWCVDRFVVCGQNYQTVREAMLKSIFGNDQLPLKNALEIVQEANRTKEIHLLLSLFREVTFSNLFPPDDRRRLSDKAVHIFEDLFEKEQLFTSQFSTAILQDVCRNSIHGNATIKWITNNMELYHQNMICLIFQFYVTLLVTPTDGTLLEPLARLIYCPDLVKDVLLPTMPQDEDDEDEIIAKQEAEQIFLEDDSDTSEDETQSITVCMSSDGVIGELRLMDDGEETTEKEQVLEDTATQEKDVFYLPSIQCTTLRIFTRIAMYLGAFKYPKVINTLLKSTDSEDIIIDNIWSHMEEELLLLQNEAGKCEEDVYLLLHYICNTFTTAHTGYIDDSGVGPLQTEDARNKWGKQFAESFLEEPLRELDNLLSNLNKNINEDNRIATDPFMRLLVEREASEEVNLDKLEDIPIVWRYKSPITLDHLKKTLEDHAQHSDFKILRMFLKEERHLKVMRSVPNIIKLQRLLICCYQDKLARSDNYSIKEAITEEPNSDLKEMINSFLEAWECVREDIAAFTFPTPRGEVQLSNEECKKITMEDHIGYLLPTFQDRGLCSYALLYFLLQKQNTFLKEYCKERRCQYSDLPVVHLKDLTSLHLITFHPTTDILPLIMANCQYTFEIDKGTRQEYIFADLEHQLIDRFLFSKSVISWSSLSEFPLMTYACERTNAIVFRELRKRVKQEPLASEVFKKIFDSESTYPDIKTSLKNLDIAISFLKSVGGDINMSLESYLSQTLQIQNPLPVLKDKMLCHCKHAQSLWIALSLEQTKHNSSYKEDIFRVIPKAKRVEMNEEEKASVQTIFQGKGITKSKKDRLLEVLFECIVLFMDVPEEEDSDVDKNSLRDTLLIYNRTPCYDISSITTHNATDITDLIKQLPATIGNTKATDVWLCMYTTLTEEKPRKKSTKKKS